MTLRDHTDRMIVKIGMWISAHTKPHWDNERPWISEPVDQIFGRFIAFANRRGNEMLRRNGYAPVK